MDPFRALEALDVDADVVDSLDEPVAEAVGVLKDDGNVNATMASLRGYGGSTPWNDYATTLLTDTIPTTRTHIFHLVPSGKEA